MTLTSIQLPGSTDIVRAMGVNVLPAVVNVPAGVVYAAVALLFLWIEMVPELPTSHAIVIRLMVPPTGTTN